MSRPMWRVYEVRSKSCSLAAEHDLDLLDGAPVALEPVVDARPNEPPAELGEGPVQRRALADRRRGGAGTRPGSRAGPGSRRSPATRRRRAPPPSSRGRSPAGPSRPRRSRCPGRTATCSSTSDGGGALAERDEGPGDERAAGRRRRPAERRSAASSVTPAATSTWRPWLQKPRASWASLSFAGRSEPPSTVGRKPIGIALEPLRHRLDVDARRERAEVARGRRQGPAARRGRTAGRPRAARRAGRCTACTAGSPRPAGLRTPRHAAMRSARSQSGSSRSAASASARPRSANRNGRSAGARRGARAPAGGFGGAVVGIVTLGSVPDSARTSGQTPPGEGPRTLRISGLPAP